LIKVGTVDLISQYKANKKVCTNTINLWIFIELHQNLWQA